MMKIWKKIDKWHAVNFFKFWIAVIIGVLFAIVSTLILGLIKMPYIQLLIAFVNFSAGSIIGCLLGKVSPNGQTDVETK